MADTLQRCLANPGDGDAAAGLGTELRLKRVFSLEMSDVLEM
jgi:hypothetical protein